MGLMLIIVLKLKVKELVSDEGEMTVDECGRGGVQTKTK